MVYNNLIKTKMKNQRKQFRLFYSLSFAWQMGFLVAAPLVILLLIGYWLDKSLSTGPLFVLTGVFGGLVVSAYEIYHLLAPIIGKPRRHGTH
jgi:F0F1-type ATP synthase assembly protein I